MQNDMSSSKGELIQNCKDLRPQFVEHFNKAYNEGTESHIFNHHCGEMYKWYKAIFKTKTKSKNKPLSNNDLFKYFFTNNGEVDEIIKQDNIKYKIYIEFCKEILKNSEVYFSEILENLMLSYK